MIWKLKEGKELVWAVPGGGSLESVDVVTDLLL